MKDAKQSIGPLKTWKQLNLASENAGKLGWASNDRWLFLYQSLSEVIDSSETCSNYIDF